ncbi:MAG: hypothetical protein EOP87_12960 [Verrucomicrobiaceae bacterium]|nr:MAG: hypothetical protein EOP87_12960 [Verrucomicrobiaceae bacterium]
MATFLGSLLTALIFHADFPDKTAFVWTMGVFAGSILVALPILVLCSVPALALINALSRRYERFLFPANVIGGLLGAAVIGVLLLLVMATMPDPLSIGLTSDRVVFAGKVVLAGFAYGMSLTLFIGLNQRPAIRSREAQPPR